MDGGAEGNRTPGLNSAIVALYQLSYSPEASESGPAPERFQPHRRSVASSSSSRRRCAGAGLGRLASGAELEQPAGDGIDRTAAPHFSGSRTTAGSPRRRPPVRRARGRSDRSSGRPTRRQQLSAYQPAERSCPLAVVAGEPLMFSTTPANPRSPGEPCRRRGSATRWAAGCGVVTIDHRVRAGASPGSTQCRRCPGHRRPPDTSGRSQNTSVANCSSILCSIGPRQMTGPRASPSVSSPTDMTRTPYASSGTQPVDDDRATGRCPSCAGIENPHTSASIEATRRPGGPWRREVRGDGRLARRLPAGDGEGPGVSRTPWPDRALPLERRRSRMRSRSFIAVRSDDDLGHARGTRGPTRRPVGCADPADGRRRPRRSDTSTRPGRTTTPCTMSHSLIGRPSSGSTTDQRRQHPAPRTDG